MTISVYQSFTFLGSQIRSLRSCLFASEEFEFSDRKEAFDNALFSSFSSLYDLSATLFFSLEMGREFCGFYLQWQNPYVNLSPVFQT